MIRRHPATTYFGLKTAWKQLVETLGGIEAPASCTRVAKSQVAEYGNIHGERFAPIDVVLDAESVAGAPCVTAILARGGGFDLVALSERPREGLPTLVARIGRDASGVFGDVAHALAGRPLTASERARLLNDLTDLRLAAAGALDVLSAGDA